MNILELFIKFQEGQPMTLDEIFWLWLVIGIGLEVWMHYGKKLAVCLARMEANATQ